MLDGNYYVPNPVFRVSWAGWGSDTLTLQRHGWQIATERAADSFASRFVLKHPQARVYGFSDWFEDTLSMYTVEYPTYGPPCTPVQLCSELIIHADGVLNPTATRLIDAEPRIETHPIDDYRIFPPVATHNQIIVDPQNVQAMLSIITQHQSAKQKELREKHRKQERQKERMLKQVHAEIVSLRPVA